MNDDYEVIIAGGSYAGLSAALALGRALRRVLVIDGGRPCNRQTPRSHNFLTQDGETPVAIAEKAREQLLKYPTVSFQEGLVADVRGESPGFQVSTREKRIFHAKKLLFATGVRDIMPPIPGFSECWGISVIHCPYCHGYEFEGEKTGILANGEIALHLARLLGNWTKDLTVYTNGSGDLDRQVMDELNVKTNSKEIRRIEHQAGNIKSLEFADGSSESLRALYARPEFVQHADLPKQLGCEHTDAGYIQVDGFQKTTRPGIFAAGDNSSMFRSVALAVAAGSMAGAAINHELIDEERN